MENNQDFIKKYISKHRAKRRMFWYGFVIVSKKPKIPIYFTKTVLKRTSNAIFNMKKVDLDESQFNR